MVRSVVQAMRILRHLAGAPQPMGVNPLARALDLSPSSCFNLLKTLTAEGFLAFDAKAKTYAIGPALGDLARRADGGTMALAVVRPRLQAMAARFRVASGLWRLTPQGRLVLLAFADSEHTTRLHMTVGQRLPMLVGAMGRCVAGHAHLSRAALAKAFAELRWERAPAFARYAREVASARTRGWALDDGDFMRGLVSVAAPVQDGAGAVRFCIANTMFQGQYGAATVREIGQATAAMARECAADLYGVPGEPAG
ncbi:MAG: helix-turn-helix domain-containing protein [Burkholderiales bacterium]